MYEPQTPTADPLPWVTDRLRRAGAFIKVEEDVEGDWYRDQNQNWKRKTHHVSRLSNESAAALLDILTQTVSALHDDDKSYVVVLSAASASAGTLLEKRVVEVGSKPMCDDTLTDGQKAAVMAGLALHEVGHIRFARQYSAAVTRLFGKGNVTGAISALSNLAADMHDETAACAAFPGLAPAIPVTLWWVGGKGERPKMPATAALHESASQRVNLAIAACRYPWQVEWDTTEAREWREWWVEWGERATLADQPAKHALIVKEAIEKVRDTTYTDTQTPTRPQPQPQPEQGEDGEEQEQPAPGRDMSDEPEQEPDEQQGAGEGTGEDDDEDGDTGHGDDTDGDTDDADDADEGEDGDEGDDAGQGTQAGKPDMDDEVDDDDESDTYTEQGSFGGTGKPFDANEDGRGINDPCVKEAAQDRRTDTVLQQGAEFINRGKREGMRIRTYHHTSSQWGSCGRRVVAHGKKGKRWVSD